MTKPSVALRMTPHLTSTPEQRYAVECLVKDAGLSITCWMAYPGEDPGRGRWASPSLEVLFDTRELATDAAMAAVRTVIQAMAHVRQGRPRLPLIAIVQIHGGETVRLGFRVGDDPDTINDSAVALTASLLDEAGALGWDADAASWVKL